MEDAAEEKLLLKIGAAHGGGNLMLLQKRSYCYELQGEEKMVLLWKTYCCCKEGPAIVKKR